MGGGVNSTGARTSHSSRKPSSANTEQKLDEIISEQQSRRDHYNLFISHSWMYNEHYENLTDMLENKNRFQYKDYSVPESEPIEAGNTEQLYNRLEQRVKSSSAVIITSGMYVNNSKWMNEELKMAKQNNKPVVAVQPRGNERLPKEVREKADKVAGWNRHSVTEAVREVSE